MKKQVGNRAGRQTSDKVSGRPVICVKCGRNMSRLRPKTKMVDDLEYTYVKCRRCGAVFVSAVTDPSLRESIASYYALAIAIRNSQKELIRLRADKTTPREIIVAKEKAVEATAKAARKQLDMNVKRSRELRERYPLETKGARL